MPAPIISSECICHICGPAVETRALIYIDSTGAENAALIWCDKGHITFRHAADMSKARLLTGPDEW